MTHNLPSTGVYRPVFEFYNGRDIPYFGDLKVGRNSDFQTYKIRTESVVKSQTSLKPLPTDSRSNRICNSFGLTASHISKSLHRKLSQYASIVSFFIEKVYGIFYSPVEQLGVGPKILIIQTLIDSNTKSLQWTRAAFKCTHGLFGQRKSRKYF